MLRNVSLAPSDLSYTWKKCIRINILILPKSPTIQKKPNSTSKTKEAKFNPWVGISKDVTLPFNLISCDSKPAVLTIPYWNKKTYGFNAATNFQQFKMKQSLSSIGIDDTPRMDCFIIYCSQFMRHVSLVPSYCT